MSHLGRDALVRELLAVVRSDLSAACPASVEAAHLAAVASLRSLVPTAVFIVAVAREPGRHDAVTVAIEGWPVLRGVPLCRAAAAWNTHTNTG